MTLFAYILIPIFGAFMAWMILIADAIWNPAKQNPAAPEPHSYRFHKEVTKRRLRSSPVRVR